MSENPNDDVAMFQSDALCIIAYLGDRSALNSQEEEALRIAKEIVKRTATSQIARFGWRSNEVPK